jgi:hypothetical protein
MQPLILVDQIILRTLYTAFKEQIVAHGYAVDEDLYTDSPADIARWNADIAEIDRVKGWHIDLYSESSARHKGMKKHPKIILFLNRVFDGDIGSPQTNTVPDPDNPGKFIQQMIPGKSSNLIFAIHLQSVTSQQGFILNAILSNTIGQRKNFEFWGGNFPGRRFWAIQTSFGDLDNSQENIIEKAYFYTVPDIFLGSPVTIRENISPIKQITVETSDREGKEIDYLQIGIVGHMLPLNLPHQL